MSSQCSSEWKKRVFSNVSCCLSCRLYVRLPQAKAALIYRISQHGNCTGTAIGRLTLTVLHEKGSYTADVQQAKLQYRFPTTSPDLHSRNPTLFRSSGLHFGEFWLCVITLSSSCSLVTLAASSTLEAGTPRVYANTAKDSSNSSLSTQTPQSHSHVHVRYNRKAGITPCAVLTE